MLNLFQTFDIRIIVICEFLLLFILSRQVFTNISLLLKKFLKSNKIIYWTLALCFLPGTVIHESCHYLAALILLVPVGKLELIPESNHGSLKLGSVSFKKTDIIRSGIIAVAPLIFGVLLLIFFIVYKNLFNQQLLTKSIYFYLIFQIGNSMFLSSTDFKFVFYLSLFIVSLFILVFILHIPLFDLLYNFSISYFIMNTFKLISEALLPVILMDIGVVFLTSIFK
jgi:hypothetical protein